MPPASVLAWEFNIRMTDSVVSRERIGTTKRLLLGAKIAAHLLLPRIVNAVRSGLTIEDAVGGCGNCFRSSGPSDTLSLPMPLTLMLLQQSRGFESHGAAVVCTSVSTAISSSTYRFGCRYRI
ncbi:hypothetical protein CTAM01_16286 [Colletotrichum tamarilloi]|uniref:Uncharacterized protein n=1 Tax=Colletotrichum tamarilloi TaxID=1209934 RepID=A0ABQ9QIX1_9PEZI|nr:uncharacterized protein CTAM01_16286 [Colletotrichum tamarilloi]KAK1472790.1 hypothetical protein CTAM01_16286 [Colletotrichum tamarilloi]